MSIKRRSFTSGKTYIAISPPIFSLFRYIFLIRDHTSSKNPNLKKIADLKVYDNLKGPLTTVLTMLNLRASYLSCQVVLVSQAAAQMLEVTIAMQLFSRTKNAV